MANAQAETFTWVGLGGTRWTFADNWTNEMGVAMAPTLSNETDLVFTDGPRDTGLTRNDYTLRSMTFDGTIGVDGHTINIFRSSTFLRSLTMESSTGTSTITVDAASSGDINITSGNTGANAGLIRLNNPLDVVHNGTGTLALNAIITQQTGEENGITFSGTGSVTMSQANLYTGNTVVDVAELTVADGGEFKIVPGANGVTNSISGSSGASLLMDGVLNFDLSGADATIGNSWLVVDGSNLMVDYGNTLPVKTFSVTSSLGDFSDDDLNGIWELGFGTISFQFNEATGMLTVEDGGILGFWTGSINNVWDAATTANWSNNAPSAPLTSVTFDVSTATTQLGTFADTYPNSGQTPVTQSMIDIGLGGVGTNQLNFENDTVDYIFTSPDAEGINGTTSIALEGMGEVTLLGTHATTGSVSVSTDSTLNLGDATADGSVSAAPIVNDGVLNFTTADLVFQDGAVSGAGSLSHQGLGVTVLTEDSSYSGVTIVDEGTLALEGNSSSPSFTIAADAVLELASNVTRFYPVDMTFAGEGTILKTGTGQVGWNATVGTFALASGSLIDIQAGQFRGGITGGADPVPQNEDWTNNFSDLNVAAGALFRAREGNVRIDELRGDGLVTTGFGSGGYMQFTIGVDNGSADFAGEIGDTTANLRGNLTKVGTGTQTLSGLNTYSGATVIEEGVITVADGGQLTMRPLADGVNNVISGGGAGTGVLNFDGTLNISLAGVVPGGTWVLIDDTALSLNYGSTFTVSSGGVAYTSDGAAPGSRVWTLEEFGDTFIYTEATRTLTSIDGPDPVDFVVCVESDPNVPGNLLFTWEGQAGTTYNILSETDLSVSPVTSWSIFQSDIVGVDGTNSLSVARPADAVTFFVLTEQ